MFYFFWRFFVDNLLYETNEHVARNLFLQKILTNGESRHVLKSMKTQIQEMFFLQSFCKKSCSKTLTEI